MWHQPRWRPGSCSVAYVARARWASSVVSVGAIVAWARLLTHLRIGALFGPMHAVAAYAAMTLVDALRCISLLGQDSMLVSTDACGPQKPIGRCMPRSLLYSPIWSVNTHQSIPKSGFLLMQRCCVLEFISFVIGWACEEAQEACDARCSSNSFPCKHQSRRQSGLDIEVSRINGRKRGYSENLALQWKE
jgi:hypothetical protein